MLLVRFKALKAAALWPSLAAALFACADAPRGRPPEIAPAPSPKPAFEGIPLSDDPNVRALLKAPTRAVHQVDALGASAESLSLWIVNGGATPVRVDRLGVKLTATREGVSFPCTTQIGSPQGYREPKELGSGESFHFERAITCVMPLSGKYDIAVYGALNEPKAARSTLVGQFALNVEETGTAPRPYQSLPGIYVSMVGERSTRPLSPEAWARGDYHVVLVVVNGSDRPVRVGSARLGVQTYRKGSPLPCSGQTEHIQLPTELLPGSITLVRRPLTCAPAQEGQYELVGRVAFGGAAEEIETGRISLRVTRDPILFDPDPGTSGRWTE